MLRKSHRVAHWLEYAPGDARLFLVMDRTNWKLGTININILLVAVIVRGQALPLLWTLLPHQGNSDTAARNALMERIFRVLPASRIAGLLADREFIGKTWFRCLSTHGVAPCIRLKADTRVGGIPVWRLFKAIPAGAVYWQPRPLMVYSVPLRVCAVRDEHGQLLYVATLERGSQAMKVYGRRWTIEVLFKHWKSSGFDLEDTHLIHPERIGTLLGVLTLAYLWAWRVGEDAAEQEPISVLAHGKLAVSVVRYGLDALKSAMINLLWNPSDTAFRRIFRHHAAKLSPT